jgi:hypothetical protein
MIKQIIAPLVIGSAIVAVALLTLNPAVAIASAESGATVRNAFGPDVGLGANQCRGACGGGCPSSCTNEVSY